jgi:hypothetical protein
MLGLQDSGLKQEVKDLGYILNLMKNFLELAWKADVLGPGS